MPLLFKHTNLRMGVWCISETPELLCDLLGPDSIYLPIPEKFHSEKRQKEWLAARLLVKELLGEESLISYQPNGAPYLPAYPFYSISISHTKGYAAVLIREQANTGIDIEYRGDRILRIRRKFMSSEEDKTIDVSHESDHLLLYWCAKETLFKMIGEEGVDFRSHLHVDTFEYRDEGEIVAHETRTSRNVTFRLKYKVTPDYVLVWSE